MAHVCDECGYKTDCLQKFEKHMNRKTPCSKDKPNANIKEYKEACCKKCEMSFGNHSSLIRHNKRYHIESEEKIDRQQIVEGDNNAIVNGDVGRDVNVNNNNNIFVGPVIHNYMHNSIDDLTYYQQYLVLTSKISPYSAIIDRLNFNQDKPEYQNMYLMDIKSGTMKVHNGNKWINESMTVATSNIVDTKNNLLWDIFNKFRIFINEEAYEKISIICFYGRSECIGHNSSEYRRIRNSVKVHLSNNKRERKIFDDVVPTDKNNETWWALTKSFNWLEIEVIFSKMVKYKIDLDKNLSEIRSDMVKVMKKTPLTKKYFCKVIKRLDHLIALYNKKNKPKKKKNSESESEISSDIVSDIVSDTLKSFSDVSDDDSDTDTDSDSESSDKVVHKKYKLRSGGIPFTDIEASVNSQKKKKKSKKN
jgi:hypothetical protein